MRDMDAVLAPLRGRSIHILSLQDDWLVRARSEERCNRRMAAPASSGGAGLGASTERQRASAVTVYEIPGHVYQLQGRGPVPYSGETGRHQNWQGSVQGQSATEATPPPLGVKGSLSTWRTLVTV